jgi:sarcosine oxidase subunit alpha
MFAGVPVAEQVMAKVARHLAGLGLLPDAPAPERPGVEVVDVPVAIIGGGTSGLAAAEVFVREGVRFVLVEREPFLGGRLAAGSQRTPETAVIPSPSSFPTDALKLDATALAAFHDGRGHFVAVSARSPGRLIKVYARRFLFAVGGQPQTMTFENNDLPGVFAGPAVSRLIRRHELLPGKRFALVGRGEDVRQLARLIHHADGQVVVAVETTEPITGPMGYVNWPVLQGAPVKAHGHSQVHGLTIRTSNGEVSKYACDAIAVCLPVSPSFELPRQMGAHVRYEPEAGAFVVDSDLDGRTAEASCFVAGQLRGALFLKTVIAKSGGRRAASAILGDLAVKGDRLL